MIIHVQDDVWWSCNVACSQPAAATLSLHQLSIVHVSTVHCLTNTSIMYLVVASDKLML